MANVPHELNFPLVVMPRELAMGPTMTPTEKSVFLALCCRIDNVTGQCWPSIQRIAKDANVSQRSVRRALARLEELGLIRREMRQKDDLDCMTSLYTLPWRAEGILSYNSQPTATVPPESGSNMSVPTGKLAGRTILRELEPKDITPPISPPQGEDNSVREIFNFWKKRTGHEKAILDEKRRRAIKKGLSFFDAKSCKQAIVGICNSSFHQGVNERGEIYDDLGLIFRDAAHAEKFREMGELYWRDEDDD